MVCSVADTKMEDNPNRTDIVHTGIGANPIEY
jgi:hypothetical protein